ncbi:MAG: DoxX family protein [Thermoanaerobaculia bacterium]
MRRVRTIPKVFFALAFVGAGMNHFRATSFYLRMMPAYLPGPLALVYFSGIAEIVLGILLLVPRTSVIAAWGLVALLVAVFPANVQMALHPEVFPEFSMTGLWMRLPLQAILIAWAFHYSHAPAQDAEQVM